MGKIITVGETMAVMSPNSPGKLGDVSGFKLTIAGAESNTGIGLARLGHHATWLSRLGADELGRYVAREISREGVDISRVIYDEKHRTGLMIKEIVNGETTVYYYRENSAASKLSAADITPDLFSGVDIVHITGVTPVLSESSLEAVYALFKAAKNAGVTVSFDPNIRKKIWGGKDFLPMLREMLLMSDVALLGQSEAKLILGTGSMEESADALIKSGVEYAAVKDGATGVLVANSSEKIFIPPYPCNPVDPVGAGDGFNAGFLAGLLSGKSLKECGKMGAIVGALATETASDVGGYPTLSDLERRIALWNI